MAKASKRGLSPQSKMKYATRQFTDRNSLKAAFFNALERIREKETYVLNFYGFGGIGKSRLMKELQSFDKYLMHDKQIEHVEQIKHIELDFKLKANGEMLQALINLRESFKRNLEIRFTYFDLAYIDYIQKSSPQIALKKSDLPFIEDGDLLWDIISEFQSVPIIGSLSSMVKLGHKLIKVVEKEFSATIKEHLQVLSKLDASDVWDELPYYFAQDVLRYTAKNPKEQVVVYFDTYEALWDGKFGIGIDDSPEKWIKDILITEMKNVLFVILGRDKLRWEAQDDEWKEYLEQHLLNELSNEDATDFIESCGIDDSEIVNRIVTLSKGHPLALDLCVDSYEMILRDRQPRPEDFSLNLDLHELIKRIIGHLNQSEAELVELLAVIKYWDEYVLNDIIKGFNLDISRKRAFFLEELSFIHHDKPLKLYKMHDIACEILEGQVPPQLKEDLYGIMIRHYEIKLELMSLSHADYAFTLNEVLRYAALLNQKSEGVPHYILKADKVVALGRGNVLKDQLGRLFEKKPFERDWIGIILANINFSEGNFSKSIEVLQSLSCESASLLKIRKLTMLGRSYHRCYEFSKAEDTYKKVDDLSHLNTDSDDEEVEKYYIENAIRYSKLLLQLSKTTEAELIQTRIYNRISDYHKSHDNQVFAVEQARLLEKMCELQYELRNLDLADRYGREALELYQVVIDKGDAAMQSVRLLQDNGLLNKRMAEIEVKKKRYSIAQNYYKNAIGNYEHALLIDEFNHESYRRKGFAARGLFRNLCISEGYTPYAMKVEAIARHAFNQCNQMNGYDASTVSAIGGLIDIKVDLFFDENPLHAMELIQEALVYFERANKLNPKYPFAYNKLVESYYKMYKLNQDEKARTHYIDQAKYYIKQCYEEIDNPTFLNQLETLVLNI